MRYSWFLLEVNPVPWTAPSVSTGRKNGKVQPRVYKNAELRTYQQAVKEDFQYRYPDVEPIKGPIDLDFFFWRQLPDYLSVDNVRVRKHQADVTNMQKALEDALQGLLFANDREVRTIHSSIVEQDFETEPKVLIGVRPHVEVTWPIDVVEEFTRIRRLEPCVDRYVGEDNIF